MAILWIGKGQLFTLVKDGLAIKFDLKTTYLDDWSLIRKIQLQIIQTTLFKNLSFTKAKINAPLFSILIWIQYSICFSFETGFTYSHWKKASVFYHVIGLNSYVSFVVAFRIKNATAKCSCSSPTFPFYCFETLVNFLS